MEKFIYKRVSELKSFDDDQGIIEGYANVYNIKDHQGDISLMGSFTKTVTERAKQIKIFKNHEPILVGVPVAFDTADSYGLGITAKMLLNTDEGRNTYNELKFLSENGFEAGLSIGGWVVKRNQRNKAEVQEYKLKEISVLTTEDPANELSVISAIKSVSEMDSITQDEFWAMIEKAYNVNFSDDILKSLEYFLSLRNSEPEKSTHNEEPNEIIKSIYEIYKNL